MRGKLFGKDRISRRSFLAAAGSAPLVAAAAARAGVPASSAGQPNILIILSDQLAQQAVGIYGNRDVRTPNIDELARGGVRFSNAYTSCPLCQPARASLWTGLLSHQTGVDSNGLNYPVPTVSKRTPTLGEIFSKAGYDTVNFGKRHDAGSLRGFRLVDIEEDELEAPDAWPVNYDSKQDEPTTRNVVEYLGGEHNRPFLAITSLNNPHNICGWIGAFEGPHKDLPLPEGELPPLPANFEIKDIEKLPLPIQYLCCSHRRLQMASGWNKENYRHYLAAYYHYTQMMDAQLGRIMDALKASSAWNNTIVVFLSDHGDGMGAHRMVTKQVSFYEEMTRVPLIFAGPGMAGPGRILREPLTSSIDLLPTLCDLAGLKAPARLPGRSMAGWLRGESDPVGNEYVVSQWQTEWGYTVSPGRMLRTEQFKYTCYLEGNGEELYDLKKDPGETRNLIRDKGYRKELERHRRLLKEHARDTRDPFFGQGITVDPRWRSHEPGYPHHEGPSAPAAAWAEEERKKSDGAH
jgi:choline-sulfatase